MIRALSVLTFVIAVAAVGLADEGPPPAPSCVNVSGQAKYRGLAFQHAVQVRNNCKETVTCYVSTDVDPTPEYKLVVEPGKEDSVVTRTNSPSRQFKPRARCTKQATAK